MSECTYCLGRGRVIGPSLIGYWWWRLTGRCVHRRCPVCMGEGHQQNSTKES